MRNSMTDDFMRGYIQATIDIMDFFDRYGEPLVGFKWFGKKDIRRIKQIVREFYDKRRDFVNRPQDMVWYRAYVDGVGVVKAKLREDMEREHGEGKKEE